MSTYRLRHCMPSQPGGGGVEYAVDAIINTPISKAAILILWPVAKDRVDQRLQGGGVAKD